MPLTPLVASYDQARSIAPDTRFVLAAQALLLRVEGHWDEAETAYRRLLERVSR